MSQPAVQFKLPDLRTFTPSIVRTFVPLLVGYFTSWPIAGVLGLQDDKVTALVTVGVTFVYYLLVRLLETYVLPMAGWLLGYASQPVYVAPAEVGQTTSPAGDVAKVVRDSTR